MHTSEIGFVSNDRIPVQYCILEAAYSEEQGIPIDMQISGRVL